MVSELEVRAMAVASSPPSLPYLAPASLQPEEPSQRVYTADDVPLLLESAALDRVARFIARASEAVVGRGSMTPDQGAKVRASRLGMLCPSDCGLRRRFVPLSPSWTPSTGGYPTFPCTRTRSVSATRLSETGVDAWMLCVRYLDIFGGSSDRRAGSETTSRRCSPLGGGQCPARAGPPLYPRLRQLDPPRLRDRARGASAPTCARLSAAHASVQLSFVSYLTLLHMTGLIPSSPDSLESEAQTVLILYLRYLSVCARLQTVYRLEPAGSRGVHGLDDFFHIGWGWAAAQLRRPRSFTRPVPRSAHVPRGR